MTSNNDLIRFKNRCLKEVLEINKKYSKLLEDNTKLNNENELIIEEKIKILEENNYLKTKLDLLEKTIATLENQSINDYQSKYTELLEKFSLLIY